MKVYLPAIAGLVPDEVVQSISAFLDFCYLVRRSSITQQALRDIDTALERFYQHRKVFIASGTRTSISLPRQHSLKHYHHLIEEYGAPNGLCSSITESKHITAVKEPWRRSNRFHALRQMLVTNQRLDKLAAARVDFTERGMLHGDVLSAVWAACTRDASSSSVPSAPLADTHLATSQGLLEPQSRLYAAQVSSLPAGDELQIIKGPRVIGTVDMACSPRKPRSNDCA